MPVSRGRWHFRQSSITRIKHLMERFKTKAIESRICKLPHDPSVSAHIGCKSTHVNSPKGKLVTRYFRYLFPKLQRVSVLIRPLTYFWRTVLLDRLVRNPAAPMDKSFAPLGLCPGRSGNPMLSMFRAALTALSPT